MGLRKPITTYALASIVNSTAATGSTGPIVLRDFDYDALTFNMFNSTLGGTNPTLDIYIQTSPDYGLTWYDTIRFTRTTASSATPQWAVSNLSNFNMIGSVGSQTISGTAGGTGAPLLSNTLQVVWALGGTTPTASFTVNALITMLQRGL